MYGMTKHTKTLKVRVKDKHIPLLDTMVRRTGSTKVE